MYIGEWVATSDRLPIKEHAEYVRFYGDQPEFIVFIEGALIPTVLCFDGNVFFEMSTGDEYDVTHWMLMPPPPEKVDVYDLNDEFETDADMLEEFWGL